MKKIVKLGLITAISLALLSGCGEPQSFEEGEKAYKNKDYKKAISIFGDLADSGDLKAQIEIADIYYSGIRNAIDIDKEKALKYYEKAALQGDNNSLNRITLNKSKVAFDILSKKAKDGDYDSLHSLMINFPKESIVVLEELANKGDVKTQFMLGDIYINGKEGIEKYLDKATQWYEKSAKENDYISQFKIASKYYEINAQNKYNEWLDKSIYTFNELLGKNDPQTQLNLGLIILNMYLKNMSSFMKENIKDSNEKYLISDYYIQREVLRDIINKIIPNQDNLDKYAISLIEKSVNQNYKDSQIILINLYDNFNFSNGRYYDMTKAVNLYEILAKQGDMEYQSILSREYIKGEHVKQDFEKAFEWAEKSANQGSISGQYNLGVLYFNGKGVEQDYKKAIELFEKSANQGSTVSQNTLGEIYIEGKGVEVNKYKAYQYWNMAKDNSFKAKENIEKLCSDPFNSEICKN